MDVRQNAEMQKKKKKREMISDPPLKRNNF